MDYIWLVEGADASRSGRYTAEDCRIVMKWQAPDITVPLKYVIYANSNPKILDSVSFPTSTGGYRGYLHSIGAVRDEPYGVLVDSLTGLSTKPVPKHLTVEGEWKNKGGGTNAEWKSAQKRGSILLRPLDIGRYSLQDVLVTRPGSTRVAGWESDFWGLYEQATVTTVCTYGQQLVDAPGFTGTVVLSTGQKAGQMYRSFGASANLYEYKDVTTLFTAQLPPVKSFIAFLETQEHPHGLVNPTLEKLNAGVYDVLTELAELTSTVEYIYSALRRIVLAFIGVKSKEVKLAKQYGYGSKEFLDELAGLWMSFRYAASPIAYSIQDAQRVLAAQQNVYITERGRKDVPFEFKANGYTFKGNLEWRCFAKARVEGPAAHLGLNPIRTLWEVTPLAFVVGWVLPVGSMLSALMPPSGATQVVASLSYRVRNVEITSQYGGKTYNVPNKIDIYKVTPIRPSAEFDLMPNIHINWKRSLDSLALSWSMFLKQFWKSKK